MLAWYRDRARALAAVLLVSLAGMGASTALPHEDDCHETACVASLVPHDPTGHRVEGPASPDDHPLHCVLCHWIRTFQPAPATAYLAAASTPDVLRMPVTSFSAASSSQTAQPPLRSPPAPPALV